MPSLAFGCDSIAKAAEQEEWAVVHSLCCRRCNVNEVDKACAYERRFCANVNLKLFQNGDTALHWAAWHGNEVLVSCAEYGCLSTPL